ncbi:hypothetical protein CCR75_005534 [Bremia lactucae]|uniref:Uncharacterized protein n=1 Tax=Bremia lactucae TaxID=4779 RepID=A0A976IGD6_BRELC|nr:hypothetical protein CCR75_005534 [Bremia lactucae]
MSDEEKEAIQAWIKANNRNKYGDLVTTMYLGGTPLFDESTGMELDLYDYILSRHRDRPWLEENVTCAENIGDDTKATFALAGSQMRGKAQNE